MMKITIWEKIKTGTNGMLKYNQMEAKFGFKHKMVKYLRAV